VISIWPTSVFVFADPWTINMTANDEAVVIIEEEVTVTVVAPPPGKDEGWSWWWFWITSALVGILGFLIVWQPSMPLSPTNNSATTE
jgi:hypothetical protein